MWHMWTPQVACGISVVTQSSPGHVRLRQRHITPTNTTLSCTVPATCPDTMPLSEVRPGHDPVLQHKMCLKCFDIISNCKGLAFLTENMLTDFGAQSLLHVPYSDHSWKKDQVMASCHSIKCVSNASISLATARVWQFRQITC